MNHIEIALWRRLISKRAGLHFSEGRLYFLQRRLWERMMICNLFSYTEYYQFVTQSEYGHQEWSLLLELLLNHETMFFRHKPSFDALQKQLLPSLMNQKRLKEERTLRLWSAGCSAGQEAYSLAMVVHRLCDLRQWDVCVWGSDISEKLIQRAQLGRYKPFELRSLPTEWQNRYIGKQTDEKTAPIIQEIRLITRFFAYNLFDLLPHDLPQQDIIFCQNVLIYFQREDLHRIVQQLAQKLNPKGYLILGPAELIGITIAELEPIRLPELLVYQKREGFRSIALQP